MIRTAAISANRGGDLPAPNPQPTREWQWGDGFPLFAPQPVEPTPAPEPSK